MLDDYNTVQFQYSHLSLNELCSQKRNDLDKLINIPIKAEVRSMIQISFRTQDPKNKTGTIQNPHQNSQLIHDTLCVQNSRIRSIYRKNPKSVRFLRPNPSIHRPFPPPPPPILCSFHHTRNREIDEYFKKVNKQSFFF